MTVEPGAAAAAPKLRHFRQLLEQQLGLAREGRGLGQHHARVQPQAECGEVNALLDDPIGHVATQIRELKRLEKDLLALHQQCDGVGDAAHCAVLKDLAQSALPTAAKSSGVQVPGSHHRHRRGAGPSSHE